MTLDITIEDDRWSALPLEALALRASAATLAWLDLDPEDCTIGLLACDDARIATLNASFRDKSGPTNVLSWPAAELAATMPGGTPARPQPDFTGETELGDIALAWDTCTREAAETGTPLEDHVTHLIVHGTLHLLGYDHERDPDATLMEGLETVILGNLGVSDPYRDDDGP